MRILPWEKVSNGPTGAPPDGMPGFINVLVQLGQLFYKGLVALGTFLVNLAEAIWDWGMRVWGAVSQAVAGAVQAVENALQELYDWIINFVTSTVNGFMSSVTDLFANGMSSVVDSFRLLSLSSPGGFNRSSGSMAITPDHAAAFQALFVALVAFFAVLATVQLILTAIDISLSVAQATGFGTIVVLAAQVAIMAVLSVVGNQLVLWGDYWRSCEPRPITDGVRTRSRERCCRRDIFYRAGAWTETLETVVINDFKVYGDLVQRAKIQPVTTTNVRRNWVETPGTAKTFLLAVTALFIVSLQLAVLTADMDLLTKAAVSIMLSTLAVMFAVTAVFDLKDISDITVLGRWTRILAPLSLGVAVFAFTADLLALQAEEGVGG